MVRGSNGSRLTSAGAASPIAAERNDRAIELSERSHVELVLYARGLEIECERLLGMLRQMEGRLTELARLETLSSDARNAIEQLLSVLPKRPGPF
jgi:hypothetical protein